MTAETTDGIASEASKTIDGTAAKTEKEAEDASKAMFNKNCDHKDAKKQSKIECLANFIKEKNLWDEYEEYEKRNYENLLNDLIEGFKNHGDKQ